MNVALAAAEDSMANQDQLVHQAHRVPRAPQASVDVTVIGVLLAKLEILETRVQLVTVGPKVHLVILVLSVSLAHRALRVQKVILEIPDTLGHPESMVMMGILDLRVQKAFVAMPEFRVTSDRSDHKVKRAREEGLGLSVPLDRPVNPEIWVPQEPTDPRVNAAAKVPLAQSEKPAPRALPDHAVMPVQRELTANEAFRAHRASKVLGVPPVRWVRRGRWEYLELWDPEVSVVPLVRKVQSVHRAKSVRPVSLVSGDRLVRLAKPVIRVLLAYLVSRDPSVIPARPEIWV